MKLIHQLSIFILCLAVGLLSPLVTAQTPPPGAVTYIHNDLLGSPAAATNQAGVVIWREAYSGYGERLKNEAAGATNKVWYTSRHQDESTGLVYMGARYYDPALGRFLSVDPVHFVETNSHSFNRYAYANNNPYKFVDPDGRMAQLAVRASYGLSFRAATYLGAATLGGFLAQGAGDFRDYIVNSIAENKGSDRGSGAKGGVNNEEQGCIYCVKGDRTGSGKDYVGSTDNMGNRQRDKSDGRDREGAEVVDTYPKGDRDTRRAKEQQAINDRGGVDKLDNKRNEVAPRNWPDMGVERPR